MYEAHEAHEARWQAGIGSTRGSPKLPTLSVAGEKASVERDAALRGGSAKTAASTPGVVVAVLIPALE